jgi:hypothetical protein
MRHTVCYCVMNIFHNLLTIPDTRAGQFKLITFWAALLVSGVALGLIAQMVLGSYLTTPTFWEPPHLVQLAAESVMLFVVLFVCCSPAGYGWLLWAIILDAQINLLAAHLRRLKRIPPAFIRALSESAARAARAIKAAQTGLQARIAARRPAYAASSKAPFLLFQQAPLLVAP